MPQVVQIMRGSKGLFALADDGRIYFRRFKDYGGNGSWRRFLGPNGQRITRLTLGAKAVFGLTDAGVILKRGFGHRTPWREYSGPAL